MPASYVVTGASGFVGSRLAARLGAGHARIALGEGTWREAIARQEFRDAVVLHLAARAHRGGSEREYQLDNVEKASVLAQAAAGAGARRFVFLSSIKVNGEITTTRAFRPDDPPTPQDAYGRSKRDAELAIREIADRHGMEWVNVRCPLVYGAPAKGHLATLVRVADSPLPLPFASVDNRRSFIAVEDLCDVLMLCAQAPVAAGKTYLVAHPEAVATPALITVLRRELGRPPRLFAVPPALLESAGALCGRRALVMRLTRSLEADASLAQRELAWRARVPLEQSLAEMVRAYRGERRA